MDNSSAIGNKLYELQRLIGGRDLATLMQIEAFIRRLDDENPDRCRAPGACAGATGSGRKRG